MTAGFPEKIRVVETLLYPASARELKSFLGLVSYCQQFVRDVARIVSSLYTIVDAKDLVLHANHDHAYRLQYKVIKGPIIERSCKWGYRRMLMGSNEE